MYCSTKTRPDLVVAASILGSQVARLTVRQFAASQRPLRYLIRTAKRQLIIDTEVTGQLESPVDAS